MRIQTADDAKRWLTNKGGRWRQQRVPQGELVIVSAKGMSRQTIAEDAKPETIESALIIAVNDLAEATANIGI
jgi:hypothetical protein